MNCDVQFECGACGSKRPAPNNELTTVCGSDATLWCDQCREVTKHSAAAPKGAKTVKLERAKLEEM